VTDDEAFIRAIVAASGDDAPRLVYADWLDERGDPRGTYLRAEAATFHRMPESRALASALARLSDMAESLDPVWVARISRPPAGVCCDRIQFVESGRALDHDALRLLQSRLGVSIPPQYAAFLLNQNGGYPRSRRFRTDVDFLTAETCDEVRGFCRVGEHTDLPNVSLLGIADDEAPADDDPLVFLGIAAMANGNDLVLMGTQGARTGRIFRPADYDYEMDQSSERVEWFPTFGAMLASLRIRRAGDSGYVPVT